MCTLLETWYLKSSPFGSEEEKRLVNNLESQAMIERAYLFNLAPKGANLPPLLELMYA